MAGFNMLAVLFNTLLFLIPLIFTKNTSELFEFNKIVLLYLGTILIVGAWTIKSLKLRKLIFRRTVLDIPLVFFLSVNLLSTLLSIDPRTSWLGYYSRFNGGLLSVICYCLLYWAYVSNLNRDDVIKTLKYGIFGTLVASILAIGERFGLSTTCGLMGFGWNSSCWVQDVQNRVFSTFGQPNWLAAAIVGLMPAVWTLSFQTSDKKSIQKIFWLVVSFVLFITLLFTKSRSGLLAFSIESILFWAFVLFKDFKTNFKPFLIVNIALVIFFVLFNPFSNKTQVQSDQYLPGPALETGGTESGTIRTIVWRGAVEIFKHYPLLGTGPETFAFAYPMFKPIEHNLTSEWDFIYNKAHNEYLNYLANTGLLGLLAYLAILALSVIIFVRTIFKVDTNNESSSYLSAALLSGFIGILTTNIFGFSVVYISLLTFLLPGVAIGMGSKPEEKSAKQKTKDIGIFHIVVFALILLVELFLLIKLANYYRADIYYNKALLSNRSSKYTEAKDHINKAIEISPNEPLYLNELATALANTAKTPEDASRVMETSEKAIIFAPNNLNLKRIYSVLLIKLSQYNRNYLSTSIEVIKGGLKIAPTDPKLLYQLGLLYLKTGQNQLGVETLEKSVALKPNYKESRFALGVIYKELGQSQRAKEEFTYILEKIDPMDELTKKYLGDIK